MATDATAQIHVGYLRPTDLIDLITMLSSSIHDSIGDIDGRFGDAEKRIQWNRTRDHIKMLAEAADILDCIGI